MPGVNYNAPVYGVKFVLTRGSYRVTFNDPTDADNIGTLTGIEGLDSPEVRESGENLQEFDGGIHSDRFYYGRRPVALAGVLHGHTTVAARNDNIQKLMDVTSALRDDMTLTWTPNGGMETFVSLRRQQPLRVEGLGLNKTFTAGMVSADPRIYSTTLATRTIGPLGALLVENLGSTTTYPTYYVTGKTTANARMSVNGKWVVSFTGSLAPDYVYIVDSLKRTVQKGARAGFRRNSFANPSFELTSGNQYAAIGPLLTSFSPSVAQPTPGSGWGTKVAQMVPNGTTGFAGFELISPDGSGYWTYPYLQKLTLGVSALAGAGAPVEAITYRIVTYNAANAIVFTDTIPGANTSTSAWVRQVLTHTNTAAGSVKARIYVGITETSGIPAVNYYWDGVDLEIGALTAGDFNPPGAAGWEWEGTVGSSSSIYAPPGTPTYSGALASAYDALDLTRTDWAGLPPGVGSGASIVGLTNQSVLANVAMTYRHAWM